MLPCVKRPRGAVSAYLPLMLLWAILAVPVCYFLLNVVRSLLLGFKNGNGTRQVPPEHIPSTGWLQAIVLVAIAAGFQSSGLPFWLVALWLLLSVLLVARAQANTIFKEHSVDLAAPVVTPTLLADAAVANRPSQPVPTTTASPAGCELHPVDQQAPDGTCWGCLLVPRTAKE